jgi:hypothetical protein
MLRTLFTRTVCISSQKLLSRTNVTLLPPRLHLPLSARSPRAGNQRRPFFPTRRNISLTLLVFSQFYSTIANQNEKASQSDSALHHKQGEPEAATKSKHQPVENTNEEQKTKQISQQQQQQDASSTHSVPKSPQEMLQAIEKLCLAGNPEEAKRVYEEYRKDSKNFPNDTLLQLLVISFAQKGQKENALLFFNELKAWRFLPRVETYEALVEMYKSLGDEKSAIAIVDEVRTNVLRLLLLSLSQHLGFIPRFSNFAVNNLMITQIHCYNLLEKFNDKEARKWQYPKNNNAHVYNMLNMYSKRNPLKKAVDKLIFSSPK